MFGLLVGAILLIDPAQSTATFSVQHIFVDRVEGKVPIQRGTVTVPDGSFVPTHVSAVLDATKLKTDDDDRDGVLQTSDWFDTKSFPTWTFESTQITPTAEGFIMTGMLTIHGVTREEVLNVAASETRAGRLYHATGKVDRHAFGLKRTQLDPAIGSFVDITLDIRLH